VLAPGTVLDIGDHSVEVLANPGTLEDRYLLRIEADPGGPGIEGDFPHLHPALVETFTCISGSMVARVGRSAVEVAAGEKVEVAEGQIHGFLNSGTDQLIVESEVIFPKGYDPKLDLMRFAEVYDRLKRERPVNKETGEPPILQMAVLTHGWRRSIKQPGIAGLLMPALAAAGRLAGYRSSPFGEGAAPGSG
jgi:mannose-6-phosphate isomerase-like protein (cupin superfamily)